MNTTQAVRLAIQCIDAEIKRLAIPANLHDKGIMDNPHSESASKRRAQLREAKKLLIEQPRLL
jgi:hypothetical protein